MINDESGDDEKDGLTRLVDEVNRDKTGEADEVIWKNLEVSP